MNGTEFRLVIIDSRMPQMSGFELAERIKKDPRLSGATLMILTSAGQRGEAALCRELGISAYLPKPIRKSVLLSAILTILGQRSAQCTPTLVTRYNAREQSRKLRILVTEDNAINQTVVMRMLEKMGHEPTLAPNGLKALSMLESPVFDLVFMDVQMPEMDGLTASRKIREREIITGAHIPIVAMTAHAMKGDKERCLAAGMDGYITKPVSSQQIEGTIAAVLGTEEGIQVDSIAPHSPFSWDSTTALRQMDGDESLLQELVQIFMEELPLHIAKLTVAIETEDMEALERTAHSLKGELSCLGLTEAAEKARDLERMGRERTIQPAAALLSAFKTEMTSVTSAMRDMLYAGR